jgi:carbamoyltransferase
LRILGIHDGHNAAAALLEDGRVVAAVQEERLNREKNWNGFPSRSIEWVLRYAGAVPGDLDAVALNGHHMPYPKDRDGLLREYRETATAGGRLRRVARRTPLKALHRAARRRNRLQQVVDLGVAPGRIHFVEHHTAHAAAAYYGYGEHEAPVLVLTNDGMGDGLCASVRIGRNGRLQPVLAVVPEADSVGNLYAVVTFLMGMVPLEHEYKLMGMAPYAPESGRDKVHALLRNLMEFAPPDGVTWRRRGGCPETYYSYAYLRRLLELQRFDGICAGLQTWGEEMLVQWVRNCITATGIRRIVLSGGVFMNVKANKVISELPEVESLFVFPSCGDETNAIGAAYWLEAEVGRGGSAIPPLGDLYWGRSFDDAQIEEALRRRAGPWGYRKVADIEEMVAGLLAEGEIVARATDRAEFGARALGNRSILADAARPEVVRVVNEMIKSRDFWMPFAPAILPERAADYLVNPKDLPAPYMVLSFDTTPLGEELRAALHPYDATARPAVVPRAWNPAFYRLLKAFERETGRGGILNTSFNLHGAPMVDSPDDALDVLESSGLKFLAMGRWLVAKPSTDAAGRPSAAAKLELGVS